MVQNGRSSGRTTSSHIPQRGGIRKTSSTTTPRVDRDGDLVMGGAPAGRGARGARGGARGGRHPHGPNRNHHNQDAAQGLKNIDSQTLEQLVVKGLRAQGPPKGPRNNFKPEQKGPHGKGKREGLDEVSVVGLKDSAAANNAGGGISDLVSFLERKASREAPQGETVKIKKVCWTSQATKRKRHLNYRLSGPLSFQVKLSERRPRYTLLLLGDLQFKIYTTY